MKFRFSDLKIQPKLISAFLIVAAVPLLVFGAVAVRDSSNALSASAFNQLESVRGIKKAQVEEYFENREAEMDVLIDTIGMQRRAAISKLTAIRDVKTIALKRYFATIEDQANTLSQSTMIVEAMRGFRNASRTYGGERGLNAQGIEAAGRELRTYYDGEFAAEFENRTGVPVDTAAIFPASDPLAVALQQAYIRTNPQPLGNKHLLDAAPDGTRYDKLHAKYHPLIRDYLEKFGYYDIFLVEAQTGNIVYSVFKELDFATSLLTGPYAGTNFAEAFRRARDLKPGDSAVVVDYASYLPSYNAPAAFAASPVYDNGTLAGVLIFQMPLDRITELMSERSGLGETGETYLVGPDHLMRSDSYLDPEHHSVAASFADPAKGKVETEAADAALTGQTGADVIIDYNGNPVLSAYAPIALGGLSWAILAEIDVAEALVPADADGKEFYADYIERYGYYDLFLMNPDGYVFYTVTREPDFQTNMVDGKYKDSGLGKLTRRVLETRVYGLEDFAPYAPSNGAPAGFIAEPLVHDGDIEMVVALQLPLEGINAIMQRREGMGETGETYLVGPDRLMRSNSFLDPENHSVAASFADPAKGSVKTEAADAALAGKTGAEIVIDYNGNPVLSAYAPLDLGGVTWALLAEIDEAEAFAAVDRLRTKAGILIAVALALIGVAGFLLARSIARPVVSMTGAMNRLADGKLETEIPARGRGDEIGQMAAAVEIFKENAIERVRLEAEQAEAERRAEAEKRDALNRMADTFESSVGRIVQQVTSASTEMHSSSESLGAMAEETARQSTAVASASEEASTNVEMVATAAEELSGSINEISRQVSQASQIAGAAVEEAEETNARVQGLVEAAEKIAEVLSMITDIASQTNLLALNATIEAARAGEAGKGFAVVASEVQNLATQTAKATEEIGQQISSIQQETREAVAAIGRIGKTVSEIDEVASGIATAVEEQGAATQEIARNIEQAAAGTQEVSANITGVNQAANDTGTAAEQIRMAAGDLSKQSETLQEEVAKFLHGVRTG